MAEVLVVTELRVITQANGSLSHVNRRRQSHRPRLQQIELSLRKHCRLDRRDKFRERADVNAHGVSAQRHGFYERRAAADVVIEHQIPALRKRLDGRANKCGRKPGRILVKPVGKSAHTLGITGAGDQGGLDRSGQTK